MSKCGYDLYRNHKSEINMAKSYRTCYYDRGRDLWAKGRPLGGYMSSNKVMKTLSHRIERAWVSAEIHKAIQSL